MTIMSSILFSIEKISVNVYKIKIIPESNFNFFAGQYLKIIINNYYKYSFSIASIPTNKSYIELHIGISRNNLDNKKIIEYIKTRKKILIDLPYGNAWLRKDTRRPIIIISGGTGFSYARSILLTVLKYQTYRKLYFYWNVKQIYNFYNLSELYNLKKNNKQFSFFPLVENIHHGWHGRTGVAFQEVMNDYHKLNEYDIYISGNIHISKIARQNLFFKCNALYKRIFSDSFDFK
ncbi:MAG: NAD(P)H-flavin reductase [Enterobacterales bacterium]